MNDTLASLEAALTGRYLIQRELGQGGMATVYLAQDVKHERMVAVKVLNPDLSSALGPERFLREIKLSAGLQHPHILSVYDSGEAGGLLYYVMPFVEGESLRHRLTREQQLPIEDAVQIAREVADALAAAHSRGIVHRDIKPENILLSGGHAVVADFGIARAVSEAGADKLTQTGMSIGTPTYMSPEQSVGDTAVDGRSDIYSLGCVLYEMLCGRPPFVGPSARAVMAQHSLELVPSLQVMRQSIPDELEDAVLRALEKVPADRFATATQFAKALSAPEATTSNPRLARLRTSRTTGTRRTPRKGWGRLGWLVAGLLPLLAASGWFVASHRVRGGGEGDQQMRKIAVLYFDDLSDHHVLQHVADGFTDALIHDLSSVDALHVISRNGVLPFKGTSLSPDSIGRALGVGVLVNGTVAESEGKLRLTVSLINARNGSEIGSKTLERSRSDIFALQDELANDVSTFLRQRLGEEIRFQRNRGETSSVAAWEAFQRAQDIANQVGPLQKAGNLKDASSMLARADSVMATAAQLDPGWIRPVDMQGWFAYQQSRLAGGFDKQSMPRWLDQATSLAEKALAIEPRDADALELRGTVRYLTYLVNLEPDAAKAEVLHQGAERDLRAAVEVNPLQASAWSSLSHLLLNKSENAEAKLAALRAYEADPFLTTADQVLWRLFQSSLDLGDAVEATHWCDEGHRRFPDTPRFTECQLWLLMIPGQHPDIATAWQLQQRYVALTSPAQQGLATLKGRMLVAGALARAGLTDSARSVATSAGGDAVIDPTRDLTIYQAIVRTMLGDRDQAIHLMSEYLASNPQLRQAWAKDDSWYFKDLRSDPRYRSIVGGTR